MASCPVTVPDMSTVPTGYRYYGNYANDALIVALEPGGKNVVLPDVVRADGSISRKMGMYRRVSGQLTAVGKRLDAPAPPVVGEYDPKGYGDTGFQSGAIHFPSEGCWEITATVGDASLTFVTLVVVAPFEPLSPAWLPEGFQMIDYGVIDLPESIQYIFGSPGEDDGKIIVETTWGLREDSIPYPEDVIQRVTVRGQDGVCVQGAWDAQGKWQTGVDAGTLEWTAEGFSYRISQEGLGLNCEDLLRVTAGSSQ